MASPGIIPGKILGHFRLTEKIGEGGTGVVYRAWDMRLERDVAVKVLKGATGRATERKRLRKEALILSRLNHPNIESIYSIESDGETDFLVFELLSGSTLADLIRGHPLDEATVVRAGIQIADAVASAHRRGILHRDLKPGNIFLTNDRQIKVLDFGLARLSVIGENDPTATSETNNKLAGTIPYMAPERLSSGGDDERSDIYSVGLVLYVMGTGKPPFDLRATALLIDTILHEQPARPKTVNPGVSTELERIILKCIDKNPEARYQSADEIAIDLKRMLPQANPEPTNERTITAPPKRRRAFATAALAMLLTAILGVVLWRASKTPTGTQHLSVVVAEFQNRSGDPALDRTPRELISTALSQSPQVLVFPSSRLPDALRRMQKPTTTVVDENVALEICSREGLQLVVSGVISRLGPKYLMLANAITCDGDHVISTMKAFSSPEQLPSAIEEIAEAIRSKSGESKAEIQQASQPLALVTSGSLDALKLYSSGKQQLYLGNFTGAATLFREAVDLDDAFAMAHEYLAIAYQHLKDNGRAGEEYAKAFALSARVTEREKLKILGDYALFHYDTANAIQRYRALAALSPDDPAVHLNLAECYRDDFRFDLAIAEGQKAVALTESPSPRLNLATYYYLSGASQQTGDLTGAILKENQDDVQALNLIGSYYLGVGREREANGIWRRMLALGGDAEGMARDAMADAALTRDDPRDAAIQLENGMTADAETNNGYDLSRKQIMLAGIYQASGNPTLLASVLSRLREPTSPELTYQLGRVYARSGRLVAAEKELQRLQEVAYRTPIVVSLSNMLQSEIAIAQNRPLDALRTAKLAVQSLNSPLAIETLARAYEASGSREEVIRQYQLLLSRGNERQFDSVDSPALHAVAAARYQLGVLYQSLGRNDLSHQEFNSLLTYASEMQPTGPMYEDARRRLVQIKAKASAPEDQHPLHTEPTR